MIVIIALAGAGKATKRLAPWTLVIGISRVFNVDKCRRVPMGRGVEGDAALSLDGWAAGPETNILFHLT